MVGAWTGDAIEGIAKQVLRAHWASRPHCTRYLAGLPARPARGPPPRNITLPRAWPLLASRARHFVPYQQSEYEVNPRSWPGWNAARSRPCARNWRYRHFPDPKQKFADPERRIPDLAQKFPVQQRREFAVKPLIVRTEVRARLAEQAIFGENSL